MAKQPIWMTQGQVAKVGPTPKGARGIEQTGRLTQPHVDLHDAFHAAENNMTVDKAGRGRYDMHHATLKPKKMRTPAQVMAQRKAAVVSGQKRKSMTLPNAADSDNDGM